METQFVLSEGALSIFCCQTLPQGRIERVVLGVHGLGGSTCDPVQAGIAQEMDIFGSATLRFDFPSHGQSPMEEDAFTLENCLASVKAVAAYAKRTFPQVEDLCIFASGFGAFVTLLALGDLTALPGNIKLVLLTPPVAMHESLLAMKGITAPTLEAMGKMQFVTNRQSFSISYQFYLDVQQETILESYPIPMLIVSSEANRFVRTEDIRHLRSLNDQAKLVVLPGTSYRFQEAGAWNMVLDLARDWFEFEQVLCCDWE